MCSQLKYSSYIYYAVCLCAQRGCCPHLELLEVNTMLDSKDCELPVYIQALQIACPKLKVRMRPHTVAGCFIYSHVLTYSWLLQTGSAGCR